MLQEREAVRRRQELKNQIEAARRRKDAEAERRLEEGECRGCSRMLRRRGA